MPGVGVIDLLAADGRGRLTLVSFCLEAGDETIGRAVAQWNWAASHLEPLRLFAPAIGLDLGVEPRIVVVAARATEAARRLAGFVVRPEIELFEATLMAAGDRRGVLIERATVLAPPPAAGVTGADPSLAALPAGEARSLMRRILEEIRDMKFDGEAMQAATIDGGVDLVLAGRPIASLISLATDLEVRLVDRSQVLRVDGDPTCRAAVALVAEAARTGSPTLTVRPAASVAAPVSRPSPEASSAPGLAAALTPEEIAEFEKIAGSLETRSEPPREREGRTPAPPQEPPPVRVMRTRFVEN